MRGSVSLAMAPTEVDHARCSTSVRVGGGAARGGRLGVRGVPIWRTECPLFFGAKRGVPDGDAVRHDVQTASGHEVRCARNCVLRHSSGHHSSTVAWGAGCCTRRAPVDGGDCRCAASDPVGWVGERKGGELWQDLGSRSKASGAGLQWCAISEMTGGQQAVVSPNRIPVHTALQFDLLPDVIRTEACAEPATTYEVAVVGASQALSRGEQAAAVEALARLGENADVLLLTSSYGYYDAGKECGKVMGQALRLRASDMPPPNGSSSAEGRRDAQ